MYMYVKGKENAATLILTYMYMYFRPKSKLVPSVIVPF